MKANEAPKKLYIDFRDRKESTWRCAYTEKALANDIEYTRNDAFIEKAVNYLNSKLYDWVQTTNPNQRSYANTIMKQDFIEDFVNYMKGE